VAGVIGRKRFLYDLWGDAVNTASRMESHGTPGRIQITRATYELLADEFECELRGTIEVKGKGEVEAWYLIGPRAEQAAAAIDGAREQTR
jgi:adenylate cyclase